MNPIQRLMEQVRGRGLSVVLPEGRDARMLAAARRLCDERLATPIVLGTLAEVEAAAAAAGVTLAGITTLDPAGHDRLEDYARSYGRKRNVELPVARRVVKRALCCGGMMVAEGHAHTMVGGATLSTVLVIQAGVLTVGLAEGIQTASSFFLMVSERTVVAQDRVFLFADCGVVPEPTAEQLADIAVSSAEAYHKLLGQEPRVAMLSYSTGSSGTRPTTFPSTRTSAPAGVARTTRRPTFMCSS